MKNIETIKGEIMFLETHNLQNEDRIKHFTDKKDFKAVTDYENLIERNNAKIELLKWVLEG